jgi:hypothetical protein
MPGIYYSSFVSSLDSITFKQLQVLPRFNPTPNQTWRLQTIVYLFLAHLGCQLGDVRCPVTTAKFEQLALSHSDQVI